MTYIRDYKKVWLTRGKPSMVDRRKQFIEEGLYAIGLCLAIIKYKLWQSEVQHQH